MPELRGVTALPPAQAPGPSACPAYCSCEACTLEMALALLDSRQPDAAMPLLRTLPVRVRTVVWTAYWCGRADGAAEVQAAMQAAALALGSALAPVQPPAAPAAPPAPLWRRLLRRVPR